MGNHKSQSTDNNEGGCKRLGSCDHLKSLNLT